MKNDFVRVPLALLASAVTPATIMLLPLIFLRDLGGMNIGDLLRGAFFLWLAGFVVALAHAVLLGLPAYFLVKKLRILNWWISLICSFIIGAVPFAIISWPSHMGQSYWADGVAYEIKGVVTTAGWFQYIYGFCGSGFLGMLGGFSAWLVWRYLPFPTHRE